jgi:hypothetical protein
MMASCPASVPTFEPEEHCCPFCHSDSTFSNAHEHRECPSNPRGLKGKITWPPSSIS